MGMFRWSGMYVNPDDVTAIYKGYDAGKAHPYYMTVYLRNGTEYRVNYLKDTDRNYDAEKLANLVNTLHPDPVTRNEIEDLLDRLKGAIRRDIKALREDLVKEG